MYPPGFLNGGCIILIELRAWNDYCLVGVNHQSLQNPDRMPRPRQVCLARTAANPLDYKKVITERSFAKDWKPQNPLGPHQRMRNVVAYANS
eukprot:SAG22_NODE_360_length_11744_cov_37.781623_7_plen_92_part_00